MELSYKNLAKDEILNKLRNIRYSNAEMLYGFENSVEMNLTLNVDVQQIAIQADVFAREILTHRSKFDLKRFLGNYQEDWLRLLHEAYVYDRIKCIYYGIMSFNLVKIPSGSFSFPGNILLMKSLIKRNFQYTTADAQPFSLYVNISYSTDIEEIFSPIFKIYPSLKEGMSDNNFIVSYVNSRCESILKGLHSGKQYLDSRSGSKEKLFQITEMNDSAIDTYIEVETNPIMNSFLSEDGEKFYFIFPSAESGPEAMRFNESLFASRAMGFISNQLNYSGNAFYTVSKRNKETDFMAREEVYAITKLKSEIVPYSNEQIKNYLSINSYPNKITNSTKEDQTDDTP